MPSLAFTVQNIRTLPRPATGRVEYHDSRTPGLALRLGASGAATWCFRYRPKGGSKPERLTIGPLDRVTLSEAREHAKRLSGEVVVGADPVAERRARRHALSFKELADRYLQDYAQVNKTSWRNDQGYLKRCIAAWGDRPAESITRADVVAVLEDIRKAAPVSSNRTRTVLVTLFAWATEGGLIGASPAAGVKARAKERARDTVLSASQIRHLWHVVTTDDGPLDREVSAAVRLLLLSGQRPSEVVELRTSELVDLDDDNRARLEIAAARMKARKPHLVPLASQALGIVRAAVQRNSNGAWVFASRFDNREGLARRTLSQAFRRLGLAYTPRDLRRTAATGMSALGVPREDRRAVLAHVEDDVHATHYDRYDRLAEKRRALEAWERRLSELLS